MSTRCPRCAKRAMPAIEELAQLAHGSCQWCGVELRPHVSVTAVLTMLVVTAALVPAFTDLLLGPLPDVLVLMPVALALTAAFVSSVPFIPTRRAAGCRTIRRLFRAELPRHPPGQNCLS